MIRHIVLLRFPATIAAQAVEEIFHALAGLQGHLQGVVGFHSGDNVSVETDLIRGFRHAFWFDFEDEAARDAYLVDPEHQAVGARIVATTLGGAEGVIVLDMKLCEQPDTD